MHKQKIVRLVSQFVIKFFLFLPNHLNLTSCYFSCLKVGNFHYTHIVLLVGDSNTVWRYRKISLAIAGSKNIHWSLYQKPNNSVTQRIVRKICSAYISSNIEENMQCCLTVLWISTSLVDLTLILHFWLKYWLLMSRISIWWILFSFRS